MSALPDTHQMLQKTCRDFANAELSANAAKCDREHLYPEKLIRQMGELGTMAVAIPEELGNNAINHTINKGEHFWIKTYPCMNKNII